MRSGETAGIRTRRKIVALGTTLAFAASGNAAVAEEPIADAAEPVDPMVEARIQALREERDQIRLAGPIAAVTVGAIVLQGGLSTIISAQYNCPGYWDCSDETRWAVTAGSGAAILIGAMALGFSAPVLTRRLRARRALSEEMVQLRAGQAQARPRRAWPDLALGVDLSGDRRALRLTYRY